MSRTSTKGFTLVELAIVMTIIGLLIGGILKGQEMIQNARVTATVAQIKAIEAATTTFRDAYNAVPGDMVGANTKITGCATYCGLLATAVTAGDSQVGIPSWNSGGTDGTTTIASFGPQSKDPVAGVAATVTNEPLLFWAELVAANLLTGATTSYISGSYSNTTNLAFGDVAPASKLGGGFVVGQVNGAILPGVGSGSGTMSGMVLALERSITTTASSSTGFITPTKAAQIDRKMDDGIAYSGSVQAYGAQSPTTGVTGCARYVVAAGPPPTVSALNYQEGNASTDCGLFFQIQS